MKRKVSIVLSKRDDKMILSLDGSCFIVLLTQMFGRASINSDI